MQDDHCFEYILSNWRRGNSLRCADAEGDKGRGLCPSKSLFESERYRTRSEWCIAGTRGTDNARDAASQDNKGLTLASLVVAGSVSADHSNDESYLRYERGSPFAEVGLKKVPVGVPVE